jgi:NDP-sugar pyrophosphorylase family protein
VPKILAPVRGEPFLHHQLKLAAQQGITEVVMCLGRGHTLAEAALEAAHPTWPRRILTSVESRPLGTAGAIRLALEYLDDTFLVLNGDTWIPGSWSTPVDSHTRNRQLGALITLAIIDRADSTGYGQVVTGSQARVISFAAKATGPAGLVNAGLYVMDAQAFEHVPSDSATSLEYDLLPELARKGQLFAARLHGSHVDMGTPEGFAGVQRLVGTWELSRENAASDPLRA